MHRVQNFTKIVDKYDDNEFKNHFRVSRKTCNLLINMFKRSEYYPSGRRGIKTKAAKEHILCFLWFASNKCVIRDVANLFNASFSITMLMINRVIEFLYNLAPSLIQFPQTAEERERHAEKFKEICGISGIIGCIDGSYIPIQTPCHKIRSTYVNRHDETAITLQGICDAENRFIDVFTGISSKIHDARIYKMSFIRKNVCEMGDQYHLIGDAAYPLSVNLITPYKDCDTLTATQKKFNNAFCKARVKIENTFGLLKTRFRQLIRLEMWSVLKMSKFIIACYVMHNLCVYNNDMLLQEYIAIYEETGEYINNSYRQREAGKRKRDMLADKFMESFHS
ncbi:uncharacterized protein [Linepithema humile]|uniref:uncharacterized protein isoform X1 n=2 Tax=Linepithema humile TaxID=83485 RepID=UPI00351DE17A